MRSSEWISLRSASSYSGLPPSWLRSVRSLSRGATALGPTAQPRLPRTRRPPQKPRKSTLVEIKGQIYELGKAVDGRLSKLLEQTEARGKAEGRALHAEGVVQGEQAERDRTSNGDVK